MSDSRGLSLALEKLHYLDGASRIRGSSRGSHKPRALHKPRAAAAASTATPLEEEAARSSMQAAASARGASIAILGDAFMCRLRGKGRPSPPSPPYSPDHVAATGSFVPPPEDAQLSTSDESLLTSQLLRR